MTIKLPGVFSKARSRSFGTAFIIAAILVLVEVIIILQEGWLVRKLPLGYLYTALQKYFNTVEFQFGFWNTNMAVGFHDNLLCPLYMVSTLFGHLIGPTPMVFRMASVLFLVIIFIVSYFLYPKSDPINRLVTAVTVTTTPVVFYVGRYLEDYVLGILLLLISAAVANRILLKPKFYAGFVFYLMPAVAFGSLLMITNFIIWCMAWAGIFLFLMIGQRKNFESWGNFLKWKIGRIALGVLGFVLVWLFHSSLSVQSFVNYYIAESMQPGISPVAWYQHFVAYPKMLLLSSAGVIYCGLAMLSFTKRFRFVNQAMYVWMVLLPLIALTLMTKKNHYYVWMIAPIVAIMAAGCVTNFPVWLKKIWIGICVAFALLHLVNWASPLERFLDDSIVEAQNVKLGDRLYGKAVDIEQALRTAARVLPLADQCDLPKTAPLIAISKGTSSPEALYFAMLYLDQDRSYWFINDCPFPVFQEAVVIFVDSPNAGQEQLLPIDPSSKILDNFSNSHRLLNKTAHEEIYCPVGVLD